MQVRKIEIKSQDSFALSAQIVLFTTKFRLNKELQENIQVTGRKCLRSSAISLSAELSLVGRLDRAHLLLFLKSVNSLLTF